MRNNGEGPTYQPTASPPPTSKDSESRRFPRSPRRYRARRRGGDSTVLPLLRRRLDLKLGLEERTVHVPVVPVRILDRLRAQNHGHALRVLIISRIKPIFICLWIGTIIQNRINANRTIQQIDLRRPMNLNAHRRIREARVSRLPNPQIRHPPHWRVHQVPHRAKRAIPIGNATGAPTRGTP